jgi:putative ABC transport system substrate-binding protein
MIRRRDFIAGIGSATAWPVVAQAQQAAVPVIGYLSGRSREAEAPMLSSFRQGLRETGHVENRNVEIEFRFADGNADRLPALATDLVHRQLAVIVAVGGNLSAPAARAANSKLPIVFNVGRDPIELGLVASFNRPGGNLTGIYTFNGGLVAKSLMLLHELAPKGTMISLLTSRQFAGATQYMKEAQEAAATLGFQLRVFTLNTDRDIDATFATLMAQRPDAILVPTFPLSISRAQQIAALAARVGVPALYGRRDFAAAGGLMSYGDNVVESYRQTGIYAGRILKGDKPSDLPVIQTSKLELVINLKTAKSLGLTIPETLLATADEVIQ